MQIKDELLMENVDMENLMVEYSIVSHMARAQCRAKDKNFKPIENIQLGEVYTDEELIASNIYFAAMDISDSSCRYSAIIYSYVNGEIRPLGVVYDIGNCHWKIAEVL